MTMPERIQLRRTKGWRKPEDAIVVARPSKWGNPFWHAQKFHGLDLALALYRNLAHGIWDPSLVRGLPLSYYDDHQAWLRRVGEHPIEAARRELTDHNLACWCPLDQPCHADVLLDIANARPTGGEQ